MCTPIPPLDQLMYLNINTGGILAVKTSGMAEDLYRCRGDLEALKNEREMMIEAHQNQIEDLRNSFRRKLGEMEGCVKILDVNI